MIHPIPPGTRDVLPDEMRELRQISDALRCGFEDHGYGEVYTPALEYEEVLSRADLAEAEQKRAKGVAPEKMFFAYSGSPEPGKPYTYHVYAPDFVVEFLNVQADSAKNPANHIHSTWRRLPSDFALNE